MANEVTRAGAFMAVITLLAAIALIGYQITVKGCTVKSIGELIRADFDCPKSEKTSENAYKLDAPGKYLWPLDNLDVRCDIPTQIPTDIPHGIDITLPIAAIAMAMLNNSVLPHGDLNRIYRCWVDPVERKMRKGVEPFMTAPDEIQGALEARFTEQGRTCGIMWNQINWKANDQTIPGKRLRRKYCIDNGHVIRVEDLD